jgi:putative membrane protein
MISLHWLPTINAGFNTLCTIFLITGYVMIRRNKIVAHRACMLSALGCSALFLVGYLTYHFQAGTTRYEGEGILRAIYFMVLLTHTVLAVVIVPMVLVTLVRALGARFDKHKAIARWTLPIWLYVSVTGVVVYLMLYRL